MYTIGSIDGNVWTANDEILAKRAADMLNQHYPNYLWAVNVNSTPSGGVMIIKNFSVSYRYGYVLHTEKLDNKLKKVMRAGGDILERAKLNRGRWLEEELKHIDGVPDRHQPIPSLGIII